MKVYLLNYLANVENEICIEKLKTSLRGVISVYAQDSTRDTETQTLSVDISNNQIHKTGNLLGKLKIFIGAKVMLTANVSTLDHFINESAGRIEYMQMSRAGNNLVCIIYVKFDEIDAGNSPRKVIFKEMN